jgi:hypothetical protein
MRSSDAENNGMARVLGQLLPFVSLLLLLLAGGEEGLAQMGALKKDPSAILKKYLSLDMKGARLDPLSWEAQRPLISWEEEPIWGRIVVVTDYLVSEEVKDWEVKGNLDVVIPVEFKVLGSVYLDQATFLAESQVERIHFRVKAVRGLWRIVEPLLPPHIGQKRMLYFVRQAMLEESEPSRLAMLTALRDDLKKAQ